MNTTASDPNSVTDAPPEFVYFDLGNILYHFDVERSYRQIAAAIGATIERVRYAMAAEQLGDAYERGELDDRQFVQELCQTVDMAPPADIGPVLHAAGDMFTPIDGMTEIVHRTATRVPIGLLSNTCAAHFANIHGRSDTMTRMFDPIILSYEVGVMKPAAAIYQAAAETIDCPPQRILFLDDKLENVAAARRQGWQSEVCTTADQVNEALRRHGL